LILLLGGFLNDIKTLKITNYGNVLDIVHCLGLLITCFWDWICLCLQMGARSSLHFYGVAVSNRSRFISDPIYHSV